MKKNPKPDILWPQNVKKLLLTMKISFLLLVLTVLNAYSTSIYSQNGTVSVEMQNATVREVVREIERQGGINFLFNDNLAGLNQRVNVSFTDQPIKNVLTSALGQADMMFEEIKDDFVVLLHKSASNHQEITVSGTITDVNNDPLPGVAVVVQGTSIGTTTNMDGRFSLSVPDDAGVLIFSYVGMISQQIAIGDQRVFNITMEEDVLALEELVVVGYGTQRRVNLTGSLSIIESEELQEIAVPQISQGLMGRSPGVFIYNHSGQPGENNTLLNVRGFGEPLIIVDGSPVSASYMNNLEPGDIESFNVLKDASAAAIYGARAGNGVILITTKRGRVSAPEFSYSGHYSQQFFTMIPERVGSYEYAAMYNVGLAITEGGNPMWTEEEVQKFRDGSDPINYPNTDWWRETLKDNTPLHQHNLSVRGGTDRVRYFGSLGFMNEKGMHVSDDINHDRFSLRSNIDVALTSRLDIGIDISLTNQDYIGPSHTLEGAQPWFLFDGVMSRIWRSRPFARNYDHPDPQYLTAMLGGLTVSPYHLGFIDRVGFNEWNRLFGFAKLNASYDLPYGFGVRAIFDLNRTYYRDRLRHLEGRMYDRDEETGQYIYRRSIASYNILQETNSINNNLNQQYFLTWDRSFENHELNALFVHERLYDHYDYLYGSRRDFEFPLNYLFAGPDANKDNQGYATEGGRESYITRLNYILLGRYLFEYTGRWDGSPKFPADSRWGFFPSASVGWLISQEGFMDGINHIVPNLKLRASHGRLGYDAAGAFQYLSTFSIRSRYMYQNQLASGIRADALPNPGITWEKMTTSNVGLDISLFSNRLLDLSIDYFYRLRTDVLGTRILAVPDVVGATLPRENINEYDNRGWEFIAVHRNNVGEVNYRIGGNISTNREKLVYRDQAEYATMEAYRRGNMIGEWTDRLWTYPTDGLFKSQEEIDNWADIDGQGNRTIQIGDIKYVDYNGDGRITPEDMIVAGRGSMPRLIYGIDFSLSWNNFDFMMLWQGAGLYTMNLRQHIQFTSPFWASNTPLMYMYENMYTPENPWMPANTEGATWPRYGTDAFNRSHTNYNRGSQFWLEDGAYVRLKNVQLGYNIPSGYLTPMGINNLKIYVSGYNLLTISKFKDIVDPEIHRSPAQEFGAYYPTMANMAFGVQMNF